MTTVKDFTCFNNYLKVRNEDVSAVGCADIPSFNEEGQIISTTYVLWIYTKYRVDPIAVPYLTPEERDTAFKKYNF